MPKVNLNNRAIGFDHVPNGRGYSGAIHPVEGLSEADDSEGAERSGELLGPILHPGNCDDPLFGGCPPGLGQHARVWVQTNNALEEACEEEGDGPGSAADVEEASAAVQNEVLSQGSG